jgi:hypothetical protein
MPARTTALGLAAGLLLSAVGDARAKAYALTEERAPCAVHAPRRRPLFGELHIHTRFSQDAMLAGVRASPDDAYRFALPGPLSDPGRTRTHGLRRPLDFAAVTDHAEYFGPVQICLDPSATGYASRSCRAARGEWNPWWIPTMLLKRLSILRGEEWTSYLRAVPTRSPICDGEGVDCDAARAGVWTEIQRAAEAAYDRSERCSFTSFVAYEFSAAPNNSNLHRNVVFRNAVVPRYAFSAVDAGNDPRVLWQNLRETCLDAGTGCDALAIPHNSNLSLGRMFQDPADAEEAALRAGLEPLVEVYQHKGNSECAGAPGSPDELCDFERIAMTSLKVGLFGGDEVPPRSYVREALGEGLRLERELGVNPFQLGIIAGTDNHNATPGDTREGGFEGGFGSIDADVSDFPANRMTGAYATFSPGGLAVVWAEENSRDAIFAALRRREVYGTSGTRPWVRFFGGWDLEASLCDAPDFAARGYAAGVPMGGVLAAPAEEKAPTFAVRALKDVGDPAGPGADLQRIEIIKGWLAPDGRPRQRVYDVAGDRDNGASVDRETLEPVGPGQRELCAVWHDPEFDPGAPAFYYVRVLENPTARWTTRQCRQTGVDVFADPDTCRAQVQASQGRLARYLTKCCAEDDGGYAVAPVIQERAWTSPIWYRPAQGAR